MNVMFGDVFTWKNNKRRVIVMYICSHERGWWGLDLLTDQVSDLYLPLDTVQPAVFGAGGHPEYRWLRAEEPT